MALALLWGVAIGDVSVAAATDVVSEPQEGWTPLASRQPADDVEQATGAVVGSISIPAIGVEEEVRAGVALEVIDQGPAHWVGTAQPGTAGNVVVAGHRSTHSAPFRNLDQLTDGDVVIVTDPVGFDMIYRVTETFIVTPDAIWITYDNGEPLLTLFACHPVGSAAQRIVIRAELVGGRPLA
jgi:sortase A